MRSRPTTTPPAGTCRFPAASPYGPAATSHRRESRITRHHRGFTSRSPVPVFSSPVAPGWNEEPLGFFPELRTPQLPATHAEAGTGHRALARDYTYRHQSNLLRHESTHCMRPRVARPGSSRSSSATGTAVRPSSDAAAGGARVGRTPEPLGPASCPVPTSRSRPAASRHQGSHRRQLRCVTSNSSIRSCSTGPAHEGDPDGSQYRPASLSRLLS